MPRYRALQELWHSSECRHINLGEEFEAEFPVGYQSSRIETIEDMRIPATSTSNETEIIADLFDTSNEKPASKTK